MKRYGNSVTLTAEDVDCILVTATEGGTGYWAQCDRHQSDIPSSLPGFNLFDYVDFYEMEEGENVGSLFVPEFVYPEDYKPGRVDKAGLEKAIERVLEEGKTHPDWYIFHYVRDAVKENDLGCIDADAADVLVQYAALGEHRYG